MRATQQYTKRKQCAVSDFGNSGIDEFDDVSVHSRGSLGISAELADIGEVVRLSFSAAVSSDRRFESLALALSRRIDSWSRRKATDVR